VPFRWNAPSGPAAFGLYTVLALLPFVHKAFHIDDPLFLWTARQIQEKPADFYGFRVNWNGRRSPMYEVMQNPPGMAYFLAGTAAVFGWTEAALHLACLAPAIAAITGTWSLARRFCGRPDVAALSVLAAPAFLVSSTNVMCDTLLLALFIWAVELWLAGLEQDSPTRLAASALIVGAAALTKYFAVSLIPLLFAATLLCRRRACRELLYLLLPVALLTAYEGWTWHLYDQGLLWNATRYSVATRETYGIPAGGRLLNSLSFLGGGMFPIAVCGPLVFRPRVLAGLALAAVLLVVLSGVKPAVVAETAASAISVSRWRVAGHLTVFVTSGLLAIVLVAADVWNRRDRQSALLALWIAGTLTFTAFLNWTVSGRSLLPAVPALGIVLARAIESGGAWRGRRWNLSAALVAVIAMSVAWAVTGGDQQLANAARRAAGTALRQLQSEGHPIWFSGHWGFQWYMEEGGAKPITIAESKMQTGDCVVFPFRNTGVFGPPDEALEAIDIKCVPLRSWMSTMEQSLGAGFYSDVYGPLPFILGNGKRDCYGLMRFRADVAITPDGAWIPRKE
jgi:4-amino-4-deoxy-L-arabinose transferase-like glycosyltransferase